MFGELGVGLLLVFIVSILIFVLITQFLWNNVMTTTFGLREIDFLQTFGLLILANIFFGSHCNYSMYK
jgi:hypothetical protein